MLLTVGHGTLERGALAELLVAAGVQTLVDVRRFPGSRTNPDVRREAMEEWVPAAGPDYRWEQRLGGRRHLPAGEPSLDPWWTVSAFRAYAAHTRSEQFRAALGPVLEHAATTPVAVLCSESVWWRCHRRLIADVTVLTTEVEVRHLFPTGRLEPHRPAEGARVDGTGQVFWDRPR